jgi:ferredoxin
MQVTVDRSRCCGAGHCVLLVPQVFDQDDKDGVVILRQETPAEELHLLVRQASRLCPTKAIRITE